MARGNNVQGPADDVGAGIVTSASEIQGLFDACRVVLFDCDGVLVNSEPISLATLVDVLDHFNAPLSLRDVSDRFTGRSSSAPIEYIKTQTGRDVSAEFKPYYYKMLFDRYDRDLTKIDGIETVLTVLQARDIAFCISSSSSVERLEKPCRSRALALGLTGVFIVRISLKTANRPRIFSCMRPMPWDMPRVMPS